jgi:aspartate aminotransferase
MRIPNAGSGLRLSIRAPPPADYPATFPLHTYSKILLAPSQRAGYLAMPPDMPGRGKLRRALLWGKMSSGALPDTAMQHAMPELETMSIDVTAIQRRRDRMVADMREMGYVLDSPEGAFYLFPKAPIPDAIAFCDWLADHGVYNLPGEPFERPGRFRLSLTANDEMVAKALPVLAEAMHTFAPEDVPISGEHAGAPPG